MFIDYLIFVGLVMLAAAVVLGGVFLIYRRGIIVSMAPVGVSCVVAVAIASFVLGKQGFTLIGLGVALVCIAPLCFFTYRYLINKFVLPIQQLNKAMIAVSEGDLNCSAPEIQTKDELGEMSVAFSKMLENLCHISGVAVQISSGNLSADWQIHSDKDVLGKTLSEMIDHSNDSGRFSFFIQ